jgi:galactokinase/mevalonate kinase-like predicted kinase
MKYGVSVPARINVLGNPSDANEGAHQLICAAIEERGGAFIEESDKLILELLSRIDGTQRFRTVESESFDTGTLEYGGEFDLAKAAINILRRYSHTFATSFREKKPRISTWTDIPRQSGLGGSSVLVLAVLGALRAFYCLDEKVHNDYVVAEIAQKAEAEELGITCGYADRYVPVFGDIAYVDFRGKLFHNELKHEPYATYEKLGDYVRELPLVIVSTGVVRDSGEVHGVMRARYLAEYEQYERQRGEKPFMVRVMEDIGATAWRGKIALLEGDWRTFGELMNENHRLTDEMMRYCGFTAGAGTECNLIIQAALDHGALGAKLTGAGGGGSIFALADPVKLDELVAILTRIAEENGLENSVVRKCKIARQGLTVWEC